MKYLASLALAFGLAASGIFAQDAGMSATQYGEGLLGALRMSNLTMLADIAGNNTALVTALMGSNKTVLAPSNQAFAALGDNVSMGDLIATIQYHVLNGTYNVSQVMAGQHTIAGTLLTNETYVQLPGSRAQVVVLGKASDNNTVYVSEAGRNVSFASAQDGPTFMNLLVQPIETVLMIPGNSSDALQMAGATTLATQLQQLNLADALNSAGSGLTVFAPSNEAFGAVMSQLEGASQADLTNAILNHVINGTTIYSPSLLADGSMAVTSSVSASGNTLTFSSNDTGAYVQSGNISARIVRTDIVSNNAVVHVIDNVLVNTTANPEAAGAAFSSATAAQATQTSVPGVMGGGSGSGSGSSGTGNTDAQDAAIPGVKVGLGFAALAMLGSAFFTLL